MTEVDRKRYTDRERAVDYKNVFGTPEGQRVLTDIMHKGGLFTPNEATGEQAHRIEGARHLALHISSFVRFDASKFIDAWVEPKDAG